MRPGNHWLVNAIGFEISTFILSALRDTFSWMMGVAGFSFCKIVLSYYYYTIQTLESYPNLILLMSRFVVCVCVCVLVQVSSDATSLILFTDDKRTPNRNGQVNMYFPKSTHSHWNENKRTNFKE